MSEIPLLWEHERWSGVGLPARRGQGRGALGTSAAKGAVGLGVAHCCGVVAPLRKPLYKESFVNL